ncbi:MAG: putative ATPase [Neolewinella sp.]|jgi:predicted ATPase
MVKRLHLENWKSFADATLVVQPLTVLVGTNASGKSNIFEAFSLLKRLADGFKLEDVFKIDHSSFPIRGGSSWVIRKGEKKASISVFLQDPRDKNQELKYQLWFATNTAGHFEIVHEGLFVLNKAGEILDDILGSGTLAEAMQEPKVIILDVAFLSVAQSILREESAKNLTNYALQQLKNIAFVSPVPLAMRGYVSIGDALEVDASNVAGVLISQMARDNSTIAERLNRYVRILPDFDLKKIYAEAIKPLEKDAMLFGIEKTGVDPAREYVVDARTMSDGTLHFIGIVAALLTVPTGNLLIMEEINQGLHPSRAKDLIKIITDIIVERKIDVMFSTHDPAILDAIGIDFSENIQVVSRNEVGVSEVKVLRDFKMFGKLIGRGSLGTLSTRGELAKAIFQ